MKRPSRLPSRLLPALMAWTLIVLPGRDTTATEISFVPVEANRIDPAESTWTATGDLDGDGDLEAVEWTLATGGNDGWAASSAGVGWPHLVIEGHLADDRPREVRSVDLDGDGDLDLLAFSLQSDEVVWWKGSVDGAPSWRATVVIDGTPVPASFAVGEDLDDDGDLDLLGASFGRSQVCEGTCDHRDQSGRERTLGSARGAPPTRGSLVFEDHGGVNPFTGGVAWETEQNADVLSMEWAFVGVSEVLPDCNGSFDWTTVDDALDRIDSRAHQAILRPVFFGPGYGDGSYVPTGMPFHVFTYDLVDYQNPDWDQEATRTCVLEFIDAFTARYADDLRVAYVQMGLAGLWGEHHLDGATYTASNFPSMTFQKTMIEHYLDGLGTTSSDLLASISLDSAQEHGFFGAADASLDAERIGFFDDSLLVEDHSDPSNWRQQPDPAQQLALHRHHGWGGEAFWSGCNSDGSWVLPPHDCGNGESLGDQAERLGLNYMLGSPAFEGGLGFTPAQLLTASQRMGYKFTATSVGRLDAGQLTVTVENTGAAWCPYFVEVCTAVGCGGDLSSLAPGESVAVSVPASTATSQTLFFASPRLDPSSPQKILWSNAGADDATGTLTVDVDSTVFADGFESGSTSAWAAP